MFFAKSKTIGLVKPIGIKDSLRIHSLHGYKAKSMIKKEERGTTKTMDRLQAVKHLKSQESEFYPYSSFERAVL